jgi:hypothetical protein
MKKIIIHTVIGILCSLLPMGVSAQSKLITTKKLPGPNVAINSKLTQIKPVQPSKMGLNMVSTSRIKAVLIAEGQEIDVSGRMSFHFAASAEELKNEILRVEGFNIAYFDVPQKMISSGYARGPELGVLGFAAKSYGEPQYLNYVPEEGKLYGVIEGYVDAEFMSRFAKPTEDDFDDFFETPTQPAKISLMLDLKEAMQHDVNMDKRENAVRQAYGSLSVDMDIEHAQTDELLLPRYHIEFINERLVIDYTPIFFVEIAKRLCIQPVRIGKLTWYSWPNPIALFDFTGDGLPFGMPGATTEWAKADVVFTVKDWITLWKPQYWQVDTAGSWTSAEESDLLAEVNDSQCIEVYFIDDFVPESAHGGGATWGSGTSGSKIITSDGNAAGGIDLTHLAHELGHVMGLRHPGSSPTASAVPGSSGTLMCPSGWMNDNPKKNSQENEDNLSNPLFTFAIKPITAGPDCTDSADCGSCP